MGLGKLFPGGCYCLSAGASLRSWSDAPCPRQLLGPLRLQKTPLTPKKLLAKPCCKAMAMPPAMGHGVMGLGAAVCGLGAISNHVPWE